MADASRDHNLDSIADNWKLEKETMSSIETMSSTAPIAKSPSEYSVEEVAVWLNAIGLGSLMKAFKENCIDGALLKELSDEELTEELGMDNLQLCLLVQDMASPKRPSEYTCEEVCNWLYAIGLEKKIEPFRENCVDGALLVELSNDDLVGELSCSKQQARKLRKKLHFSVHISEREKGFRWVTNSRRTSPGRGGRLQAV